MLIGLPRNQSSSPRPDNIDHRHSPTRPFCRLGLFVDVSLFDRRTCYRRVIFDSTEVNRVFFWPHRFVRRRTGSKTRHHNGWGRGESESISWVPQSTVSIRKSQRASTTRDRRLLFPSSSWLSTLSLSLSLSYCRGHLLFVSNRPCCASSRARRRRKPEPE